PGQRHRDVRRRVRRTGRGTAPDPVPGLAVPSRYAQRRRALALQPPGPGSVGADKPTHGDPGGHRVRLGMTRALAVILAAVALAVAPGTGSAAKTPTPTQTAPAKPHIVWDPIPFGAKRKAEMVAYVRRHYGSFMKPTWRLIDPHVIVIHYTESSTL